MSHAIDIALVEGPVEDNNLVSEPWRTDAMVLIVAPNHRFALAGGPVSSDALKHETLIVREQGSGSLQVVNDALHARAIVPARTLEVGGTEAIKQVVAANVGVAIVSAATIKDQVELGKLHIVELDDLTIERTLWQLKKPGRLESPAATAFEKLIRITDDNPKRR
jgi:DNA-binding transcriptional LysR family regulator